MALINFDANDIEPVAFEPLPAGEYKAIIVASEMKRTKDGNGRYLMLSLQVIDGEYANRIVFDRLNLDNPNTQAVRIAQAGLASICRAVGVMTPRDSAELHDKPLIAVLSVQPATENFGASNRVKGYKPLTGTSAQASLTAKPAAQSAPPKAGGKKPWE
ncbi:MAG: DUF669 domain-containing protein [Bacteroidales bacterium]|nr:DUF669 domain-containing protein [Bacteroidales bacterium]